MPVSDLVSDMSEATFIVMDHLRRALTLVASVDVGELIRDCHGRRAVAGTFGRDIMPGTLSRIPEAELL